MSRQIFQLKVSLVGTRPSVWRRVLVPGGYTLDRVHRVVQHAMGWRDCHLHSFEIDGRQYGEPDPDGELAVRDELDVRLDAVVGKGDRFQYVYDFGDWWEHDLLVEDVCAADPDERYPVCPVGERACPPEGIGGPAGHAVLLAALADPEHPERRTMRDWAGPGFDPAAFDATRATTLLRRFC
ncbi:MULTISPECIES: plasmid pRiA4b ORF-3 family protein [Micromonospora]|uniref:Plasmid pRiA4b ORF-3 family protein n=1 Tax=Micromonospora solifontis TaxID=2487138 RepID=A0ABX9WBU4_9ACTN|nr:MULTISPECIES: plasmid pRiA4b ORF-3 family protein [Micromonospora]NES12969.1 plasmid pRiA4b ORF-3 family protein [Micromonospora sp. PPF5-17B]NES38543.1 plasmid pRiA4b ORF-3 family protein [Micromonospora solifontis]NES54894.1 plasmid pRiA4b ORF-3 family protein [Micromonospora sp. PPF5-6]RNL94999.1 plasmid pRiA4b ORF-3 family protein [Micromonospora solifontis]